MKEFFTLEFFCDSIKDDSSGSLEVYRNCTETVLISIQQEYTPHTPANELSARILQEISNDFHFFSHEKRKKMIFYYWML